MWCVYLHTNKINRKMYCGITGRTPNERWKNGIGYIRNMLFYNAIKKYGWNNFEHTILHENLTQEDAEQLEKDIIENLDLTDRKKGYNRREGGGCNGKLTNEAKQKISAKNKGKKRTIEVKKKLSEQKIGSKNNRAILTEKDVLEIRKLRFQCTMNITKAYELFKDKGISRKAFPDIWNYREWEYIGQEYNTEEVRKWHKSNGKASGENNSKSKLTNKQVENIKLEFICGANVKFLTNKYNVRCGSNIYYILKGKLYSNIRQDLNGRIEFIKSNKFVLRDSVFNLYKYGLPYKEIAEILNISIRTITCCVSSKKSQMKDK